MSFDIINNIVYYDPNDYQHMNYAIDFCNNTYEINFDTTIANI